MAETLTVTITDIARGGAGVARDQSGRVIFVPYTAPGDQARVRIREVEKRYAQAELVEILAPGPGRITPKCEYFTRCGGCQWQHIGYGDQWKIKSSGVRYALERMQVELPADWDELPAERIWEYRNRIQLRGQGDRMGFFAAGSNDLIPVNRCEISRPEISARWEETRKEGQRRDRPYKVEMEVLEDGSVRQTWNSAHAASGFRQIHDEQNAKMKAWIHARFGEGRGKILDLFGGSGNLSLDFAAKGVPVECVDLSSPATPPPGTPSAMRFHRASTLSWVMRQSQAGLRAERAIIDPPRDGLMKDHGEILTGLETMGVRELIAVGCDPDGWARDLSRYLKRGWKWQRAAILDFFPQTPHVESLAHLVR